MATISKDIRGYEYVKEVESAVGRERTGYDFFFVVKRKNNGDYLSNIVAVVKMGDDSYEERKNLEKEYPFEDYIIWGGTICGNRIEFYWS